MRRAVAIAVRKNWRLRFREWKEEGPWHTGCSFLVKSRVLMLAAFLEILRIRPIRRTVYAWQYSRLFFAAVFSSEGLASHEGRILIWGKVRRMFLGCVPPLARHLQSKYKLSGGCTSCGSSCQILFQCPYWNDQSNLCSIYEDRPGICRLFPITPADIRDRNIVSGQSGGCGFDFSKRD